ncbi:MAG: hypothetical protein HGA45_35680 [Chloroflexales bacterium]|nr:hypothetical protein [Chloroflexales bacterium]
MWNKRAEDRAFLRDLARDIVADHASDELAEFEALVERYFADPTPPTMPRRPGEPVRPTLSAAPSLAEVSPAALVAVLNYLVIELEEASQRAPTDGITAGLKRLLRHGPGFPGEGVRLGFTRRGTPDRLTVLVYCYMLPIAVTIPLYVLYDIAETTGRIYGLDEQQCDELSSGLLARLCRSSATG